MNLKNKLLNYRTGGLIGAVLVFAIGCALWPARNSEKTRQRVAEQVESSDSWLTRTLTRWSYDWSFDLTHFARPNLDSANVVIIYMDEDSYVDLKQPMNKPWDRTLHASLLDRLKADGAKAVVMDIVFSDASADNNTSADEQLARAIRANGKVILAEDYNNANAYGANNLEATMGHASPLFPPFEAAAAAVGFAQLQPDDDFMVRQHVHYFGEGMPASLSWVTAQAAGLKLAQSATEQQAQRWVYYYGPPETIPHVSYKEAYRGSLRPGFFRDKIVFIGARPMHGGLQRETRRIAQSVLRPRRGPNFRFNADGGNPCH